MVLLIPQHMKTEGICALVSVDFKFFFTNRIPLYIAASLEAAHRKAGNGNGNEIEMEMK